ncbi:class I SAM-dependent methyltransferase [Marinifaba aquimaris]|uniref:class I SAM-dependent methyltransferase n=1 Tax=Marinifaba aquimaris TaxID=2741323 RepID=UPI0031B5F4D2
MSNQAEKATYDTHENNPDDLGYRKFLSRPVNALLDKLALNKTNKTEQRGLDFGCGPGPTLSVMMQEAGYQMANYDIYYFAEESLLQQQYDFITCTEAIEHFNTPAKEWQLLLDLLKPEGYLVIMTKLVIDQTAFANWHYKNDQTHVSFFSRATFNWLATQNQLKVDFVGKDVIIFQKGKSTENKVN